MDDPFGLDGFEEAPEAILDGGAVAPGSEELEAFTAAAEDAQRQGTTQAGAGPVGRKWIFTLFSYTDDQIRALEELVSTDVASHLVMGFEIAPTTGLPHIQGYISFTREQHGRGFLARVLGVRCFCELARNVKACIAYSKKTGNFRELGEELRRGQRKDLDEAAKLAETGDLTAVMAKFPKTYVQYPHGLSKLAQYHRHKKLCIDHAKGTLREVRVVFCFGETGAGKTRSVWAECADGDIWASSVDLAWFDGYFGQKSVLLDDFRDSQASFSWLLKVLDRYPLQVPVKGGFVSWSPERIYITCDRPPWELYTGSVPWESRKQLFRRLTEIRRYVVGREYELVTVPGMPDAVEFDFNVG